MSVQYNTNTEILVVWVLACIYDSIYEFTSINLLQPYTAETLIPNHHEEDLTSLTVVCVF